jgi:hypothetical protein
MPARLCAQYDRFVIAEIDIWLTAWSRLKADGV